MSFYGDLKSIHLADLLQNFETHGLTGTLSLVGSKGERQLYLKRGKVMLLAATDRPALLTTLERQGFLDAKDLTAARNRRKGTGKSLGEVLVQSGAITEEALRSAASTILTEDLCDLVATADGEFKFKEGKPAARVFDPEERRLELAIPVGPLLLEAARRTDEWDRIRKEVPSDSVHFVRCHGAEPPSELEGQPLAAGLLEIADGTRSARELVEVFPQQRFLAFQILAQLVRAHCVRAIEADDLVDMANRFAAEDPSRALALVRSGLEASPHHLVLLGLQASLAEQLGDVEGAASALKLIAHLKREDADQGSSRDALTQAKRLTPTDPSVWERSYSLAREQGRSDDARADGLQLVQLYREPGLHAKAREVLEQLLIDNPEHVDLCREYARTLVDCGEVREAVRSLHRVAKQLLSKERYAEARQCYGEVLAIAPSDEDALRSIELIESEAFVHRRARRRSFARRVALAAAFALMVVGGFFEGWARIDYASAETRISEKRFIEDRRYRDAMRCYLEVMERHPLSPTGLYLAPRRVRELETKADLHDLELFGPNADDEAQPDGQSKKAPGAPETKQG